MAAPDAPAHVPTEQSAQSIPASDHPSGDGLQQPPMPVGPNGEVVGYPVMNVGQIMGGPAGGAVPPEYATYVLGGMPVAPPQTFQQNGGGPPRRGPRKARKSKRGSFDGEVGASGAGKDQYSTRNLYVSGLPPTTRNEDLLQTFSSFGTIVSAKAIVSKDTPSECQGYGFVMFENAEDAATAVTELSKKGEMVVQFAKISPRPRQTGVKAEDPTNLYFSNLPLSYDEARLNAMLEPYGPVVSCRILRDYYTNASRGVGFARMHTREVCETILAAFNGVQLEEAAEPLLCKFADNPKHRGAGKGGRAQQPSMPPMGWPGQYPGGEMWSGDGFNPAMQPNLFLPPGQGGLLLPPYAPPVAGSPSAFGAPGFYYGMPPISPRESPGMSLMQSSDGSDGTASPVPFADSYRMPYMNPMDPRAMYNMGGLAATPGVISTANPPSASQPPREKPQSDQTDHGADVSSVPT